MRIKKKKKVESNIMYEHDEWGEHKVITQPNGIKVRILRNPSKKYKDKMKAREAADKARRAEKEAASAQEKLIQAKIRELAVAALKSEGKI